jgi:hypothetical protein
MRGNDMDSEKSLIVFHNNKIRRIWHDDEWNYSVSNIIAVLIDSKDGLAYWKKRIDKIENQGHSRAKRLCDTNKRDIKSNIW